MPRMRLYECSETVSASVLQGVVLVLMVLCLLLVGCVTSGAPEPMTMSTNERIKTVSKDECGKMAYCVYDF